MTTKHNTEQQIIILEKNTLIDSVINLHQNISSGPEKPPQLFGFPPLNDTIVGRDTDEKHLLDLIKKNRRVLITGIGGLGKTTLAILCATTWAKNNEFKYAVLVNADTDHSAENAYHGLSEHIFKKTVYTHNTINEVYEYFNKYKTLLVLDNIEQSCNLFKYLPDDRLENIFVLGTSQFTELTRTFKLYKLKKLPLNSSIEMISKIFLSNKISTFLIQNVSELITNLIHILDCHPLALQHAAAYIVDSVLNDELSLSESLEKYIKTFNELIKEEPPYEHPTSYRTPVHTALEINITKALNKSETTRKLLYCLSFLNPTKIYCNMLYKYHEFNKERIKKPIRELKKYSIISVNVTEINMHRLIQTVCRNLMKKDEEKEYICIILNIFFHYKDYIYINSVIRLHVIYLIQNSKIDQELMSSLYVESFRTNDHILHYLTAKLKLINCNIDDISDWSALHCSAFALHKTFFGYFDNINETNSSHSNITERYVSKTFTVYHCRIIKDSKVKLFVDIEQEKDLINFFVHNPNEKNKRIIKGLTTLSLSAAFDINKKDFEKLIKIGCDINIPDDNGMTPIQWAAKNMAFNLLFILYRAGAIIDDEIKELLTLASNKDHEAIIRLLRTSEVKYAVTDFGKTLLWWAVDKKYKNLALELMKQRADTNGVDNQGNTLLHLAARCGFSEVIVELIRLGVLINITNNVGDTPLFLAISNKHTEAASELIRFKSDINIVNNKGDTPLTLAISNQLLAIAVELVRLGSDIHVTNSLGDTPLLLAVSYRYYGLATDLIKRGANINVANNGGATPLSLAAFYGRTEFVTELIRCGANIKVENYWGDTPLMLAIRRNSETALELIRHGADINFADDTGYTPLHLAAYHGHSKVISELILKGANINVKNNKGATPLFAAIEQGHSNVAIDLIHNGADINVIDNKGNTPLLLTAYHGNSEVTSELISREANINAVNNEGSTALLLATSKRRGKLATELIHHSADINVVDNKGNTPLLLAVSNGLREVAIELMRRGCDINVANNEGNTALLLAAKCGNSEVAVELIQNGADVNVTDSLGNTSLSWTLKKKHRPLEELLYQHGAINKDEVN